MPLGSLSRLEVFFLFDQVKDPSPTAGGVQARAKEGQEWSPCLRKSSWVLEGKTLIESQTSIPQFCPHCE